VANAVLYTTVANVAAIPGSPANNAAVEVTNSTGIESFTPLSGLPAGFIGSSGLSVRIIYQTSGATWTWIQYFPNDPETRYLKLAGGTLTGALASTLGTAALPSLTFAGDTNTGIYSPGADQVAISTNSSQRLVVDATGQVGIAASVPSNTLSLGDVGAISQDTNSLYVGGNFTGTGGNFKKTGNYAQQIHFDTTSGIKFRSTSSTGTAGNAITWSESMRLTPSGRLGINTANPSHNLEVYGSLCVDGFNDSSTNYITLRPGFSPRSSGGSGFTTEDHSGAASDGLGCWGHDGIRFSTAQQERLRITAAGLVGIGTSVPGSILDTRFSTNPVVDNGGGADALRVWTSSALAVDAGGAISFGGVATSGGGFGSWAQIAGRKESATSGAYGGYLQFAVNTGSGTMSERMRLDSSGRLGIGTSSPATLVHGSASGAGARFRAQSTDASGVIVEMLSDGSSAGVLSTNSNHPLVFQTNATERARIDSSGRLLVGTSTARDKFNNASGETPNVQIEGTGTTASGLYMLSMTANNTSSSAGAGPAMFFGRSEGTTNGSYTVVSADKNLGRISFQGADGTEFVEAAKIDCFVDGTPGANDMPGRLVFSTTADGASSPTERFRIGSAGQLGIGGATYGTSGQVLTSGGASAAPSWEAPGGAGTLKAWVNFNGTGTVAIRGSGNVSSITDNGTGDYTVNFTTAMPDANYATAGSGQVNEDGANPGNMLLSIARQTGAYTASSVRVTTSAGSSATSYDQLVTSVAIFR
jgi:hypothetical protein